MYCGYVTVRCSGVKWKDEQRHLTTHDDHKHYIEVRRLPPSSCNAAVFLVSIGYDVLRNSSMRY
jgi:hypothetical protein